MGISGCGAGAVPSKQAKQTSKCLVFDAVRVWGRWCGAGLYKQRFGLVWCGGGAKQTSKGLVWVQGCGLISKQGLGVRFLCWVGAKQTSKARMLSKG